MCIKRMYLSLVSGRPRREGEKVADELFGHVAAQLGHGRHRLPSTRRSDAQHVRLVKQKSSDHLRVPDRVHSRHLYVCNSTTSRLNILMV